MLYRCIEEQASKHLMSVTKFLFKPDASASPQDRPWTVLMPHPFPPEH
jgi:hypothetical protein